MWRLASSAALVSALALATTAPATARPAAGGAPASAADAAPATTSEAVPADAAPSDVTPTGAGPDVTTPDAAPAGDEAGPTVTATVQGWIDSRTSVGYASVARLLPANDAPQLSNLSEANLQLRLDIGDGARIYTDLSLVWAKAGITYGAGKEGERVRLPAHDIAAFRPGSFVSELYGLLHFGEHWNLTLGKKRVVWGPGLAWNPTDLFNPPKDPTDPTQQRAGSWLARMEGQFERWTLSLLAAAKTTRQLGGVPAGLVYYPDDMPAPAFDSAGQPIDDGRDDEPHFAAGARLYGLVADTDVQLFAFYSHLYQDVFRHKPRFGAAFSRVLGDAFVVHGEALFQRGSARMLFNAGCLKDFGAAAGCAIAGTPIASASLRDDDGLRLKALLGLRYQFGESASVSAEYFVNAEGYDQAQFNALAAALRLRRDATRAGLPLPSGGLPGMPGAAAGADAGTPQKFAFEPLRRHYLFLSYMHPQLADDFTIQAVAILGLEDLSGQLAPQLLWSARQWLTLSAGAFITLPGRSSLGAQPLTGQPAADGVTEYTLQPNVWRAFFAARAFF